MRPNRTFSVIYLCGGQTRIWSNRGRVWWPPLLHGRMANRQSCPMSPDNLTGEKRTCQRMRRTHGTFKVGRVWRFSVALRRNTMENIWDVIYRENWVTGSRKWNALYLFDPWSFILDPTRVVVTRCSLIVLQTTEIAWFVQTDLFLGQLHSRNWAQTTNTKNVHCFSSHSRQYVHCRFKRFRYHQKEHIRGEYRVS